MNLITDKNRKSTRNVILHSIKLAQEATVDDLAEAANVSPVTVRHHLNTLQAEGLLESRSVRRKVGRPYYVYSLSEAGHELFPQRYVRLSSRLLSEIKSQLSSEMATEILRGVVEHIIAENQAAYEQVDSFESRLTFLVELLSSEGFLARWEKDDAGAYRLIEYSCPYISVGAKHSEICAFDTELMISVLQTTVQQHSCMLDGDACCQFSVVPPVDR